MSQKKVEEYKQNKANRNRESRKEVFRRKLEIGILIAVIAAGVIWFAVMGISRSLSTKTETVELKTEAIDNYIYNVQSGTDEETEIELVDDEAETENDEG